MSKNHKLDLTMPLEICKANYNTRKSLILPLISHLPASTMVLNKLLVSDDTEVFTIMTKNENENNNNIEKLEVICKAICILDSRAGTHLDVSYYNLGNRDDEFESNNLLVDFLINERSDNYLVFSGLNERYVERLCNAFNLIDVLRIENSHNKIFKKLWENPCYLYVNEAQSPSYLYQDIVIDTNQYHIHELTQEDAILVNEMWTFKSQNSLNMVQKLIASRPSIGVYSNDNELVSWVLSYEYHALGLQHTLEGHRRRGLAKACVQALLNQIAVPVIIPTATTGTNNSKSHNNVTATSNATTTTNDNYQKHIDDSWRYVGSLCCSPRPFCYIVKGNQASKNLYSNLGFRSDENKLHYWLGFQRQ